MSWPQGSPNERGQMTTTTISDQEHRSRTLPEMAAYVLPFASLGLVLVLACRAFDFAYFWFDDFDNLYWVQRQSAQLMLSYFLNPFSDYFRPTGMMLYWLALQAFDRNA